MKWAGITCADGCNIEPPNKMIAVKQINVFIALLMLHFDWRGEGEGVGSLARLLKLTILTEKFIKFLHQKWNVCRQQKVIRKPQIILYYIWVFANKSYGSELECRFSHTCRPKWFLNHILFRLQSALKWALNHEISERKNENCVCAFFLSNENVCNCFDGEHVCFGFPINELWIYSIRVNLFCLLFALLRMKIVFDGEVSVITGFSFYWNVIKVCNMCCCFSFVWKER